MDDYLQFLGALFVRGTGKPLATEDLVHARAVMRKHRSRWPCGEDFDHQVLLEMASRLAKGVGPDITFLRTLEQVADAVRHRLVRQAKRDAARLSEESLGGAAAKGPTPGDQLRYEEALAKFSGEKLLIVEMKLAGAGVGEIAAQLGVSARTVYRFLEEIRAILLRD